MKDQNLWNELFILYNEGLSAAYERAMERITDENQMREPHFQEQMRHQVLNSMQEWYKTSFENLGNRTPEVIIDNLQTLEDTLKKVRMAAAFCDDDIPEYLKIKLGSFGAVAIESLLDMALSTTWEVGTDFDMEPGFDLLASTIAMKILGEWQASKTYETILNRFVETKVPHELVADAFKEFSIGVGDDSIPYLLASLTRACDEKHNLVGSYEYLVIVLTLVSQEAKTDEIFSCLRTCFRTMQHRVIGAICLGDYGDPRGIPALKGFLDRNEGKFDRQEFYEILSSIKRLGGDISDIKDPFKDFS